MTRTADRPARAPAVLERWRALPAWAQVLAVFLASRALTTIVLLRFASVQPDTWQTSGQPGLLEFSNIWDAEWYQRIVLRGYPSELPRGPDGRVTENAWAFMPLYPALVRTVMLLTPLPFQAAAILVSLAFGYLAALVTHRLLAGILDPGRALFAVALFCTGPTSPLLQLGYAESMQMFWTATLLLLLVRRRWGLMAPVVLLASITRPTGLAWAMTLGLYFLWRLWRARRGEEPFEGRELAAVAGLGLLSFAAGFLWPAAAWAATGELHAYVDTELAWRSHYTGPVELVPFTPWFHGAEFWLGRMLGLPGPLAPIATLALATAVFGATALPAVRRLGPEVRMWLVSYFSYLFAVFFPQSSTFRLLMPMFPILGALAVPRDPVWRIGALLLCFAGQLGWLAVCWYVVGHDWTPP